MLRIKLEFLFGVSFDSENGVTLELEPQAIIKLQELIAKVDQISDEVSMSFLMDEIILEGISYIKPKSNDCQENDASAEKEAIKTADLTLQYIIKLRGRCLAMMDETGIPDEQSSALKIALKRIHVTTILFLRGLTHSLSKYDKITDSFTKRLLDEKFPHDFLMDIISICVDAALVDSEALSEVFGPVLDNLRRRVSSIRQDTAVPKLNFLKAEYYFKLLENLLQIKLSNGARPIADLLVLRPNFIPTTVTENQGREFFLTSYLGPFFNVTIANLENDHLSFNDAESAFADENITGELKAQVYTTYQTQLFTLRKKLYAILHSLVANSSTRGHTLSYLSEVLRLNRKLAQLQAEHSKLAASTAMLQLMSVLIDLSAPISIDKIQDDYVFHPNSRVKSVDDTCVSLDKVQLDSYKESIELTYTPNFNTECFYLTAECLQISFIAMINTLRELKRQVQMLQKQVRDMEAQAKNMSGPRAQHHKARVSLAKRMLKRMTLSLYCYECLLYDTDMMDKCSRFVSKLLAVLLRPITENIYVNGQQVVCVPQRFMAFPERYLDAAMDFMLFVIKRTINVSLDNLDLPSKVTVLATHLNLIKNPHLASKFVDVLFLMCPNVNRDFWKIFNDVITDRATVQHMFPCLVRFYADVETTGAHTEFYDKFNIRRNIQVIFKSMWAVPVQKDRMMQFARESSQDFIRFVNMLINDTTFLLDESLAALKQIHDIETLQSNEEAWNGLPPEDRQGKSEALAQAQGQVQIWLQLGNETMDLFVVLTEGAPQVFTQQALGERVASMLNHNLVQLCGPKCVELKVKDAKNRFSWDPRNLTEQLVRIYVNLWKAGDIFAEQVAQDERSYTPETFQSILAKLHDRNIVQSNFYELLKNLAERASVHYVEKARMEEDYGDDVPEEFADALVYTVMKDPVRLPSGQTMDRKNILRHLLSDPTDPFTRKPLKPDELVSDDDLRKRIHAWLQEMRAARNRMEE